MDDWFTSAVSGSMLLAVPVAVLAGLVSFLSPCVLPLLPAYLSYATGLSASDVIAGESQRQRGRMLLGMSLFVLGFAVVFVITGATFGGLGSLLLRHARLVAIVAGVLCIVLGLIFADLIPLGQRNVRPARVTRVGLAAAPLLGAAFAIGWTPCIGPTLAVVLTLALNEASATRGAVLAFCYALGLGIPFIVAGLLYHRLAGSLAAVKRHQRLLQRIGGVALMVVGALLITGVWDWLMQRLQAWIGSIGTLI